MGAVFLRTASKRTTRFSSHDARIANMTPSTPLSASGHGHESAAVGYAAAGLAAGCRMRRPCGGPANPQPEFFGTANAQPWGDYGIERFPAFFNGERPPVYEGVHGIGQDTFEVATELLEMSDDEVANLMGSGALT